MNATMISPATGEQLWAGTIPAEARIGHVHLRVADLERATSFYRDVLGFRVVFDGAARGLPAAFLVAGDYHHHIALNTFQSAGGTPPPAGHTGLHHFAIVYPDCVALARAVARVMKCGHSLDDARDHGGTLSVYLRDTDGNGLELYYDRPREEAFDSQGRPIMKSERFDVKKWSEEVWSQSKGDARD